jgi:hypothetical protein
MPDVGHHEGGKFPQGPRCRDALFAVLFILHLIAVPVLLGTTHHYNDNYEHNHPQNTTHHNSTSSDSEDPINFDLNFFDSLSRVLLVIFSGAAASLIFAMSYIQAMKRYARQMIIGTLIMTITMWVILGIVFFMEGIIIAGIIMLFIAAIFGLIWFSWRSRIPFAQALLETISHVLGAYPAPTYVSYLSLFVLLGFSALWAVTATEGVKYSNYNGSGATVLLVFLIFSYYWTTQMIKNVVHVTTSGLVASWYFFDGSQVGMPIHPTLGALKRACTTSFGSIALGSLLVAILKTIRQLVQSAGRNTRSAAGAIISCLAVCILGILDSLLRYFNMYAFTQVAIYGKSYCEAAKDTWGLMKSHGFAAIINDNLISGVLLMGALLGGVVTAIISAIVALIVLPDSWLILTVICFLIGVCLVSLTMEVVESSVATTFVCFAMEPQILQRNNPALHNLFVTTYNLSGV